MQGFGEIRQIAYLTDNIEAAMHNWAAKAEVGPFVWYRNLTLDMDYRGEASAVAMDVGLAFRGELQIELIQQTNDAPSPYRAFFEQRRMGLHHIAYTTGDIDASLAMARDKGYDIIATIDAPVGRYAYFQDPAMPEIFYEFLHMSADNLTLWAEMIQQAKNWDGSNPVSQVDMTGV